MASLELFLGQVDFREEQLRLPACGSAGFVLDQRLDQGQSLGFLALLEERPGEVEVGRIDAFVAIFQGQQRAVFLFRFRPLAKIKQRLGLPE